MRCPNLPKRTVFCLIHQNHTFCSFNNRFTPFNDNISINTGYENCSSITDVKLILLLVSLETYVSHLGKTVHLY